MDERRAQHYFAVGAQQAGVALGSVLEALAVGMFLTADERVLQYFSVEKLYLRVLHHGNMQILVGDGIDQRGFQRLHHQFAGFLFQEALDAEADASLEAEVLGHVPVAFVVVLSHHALMDIVDGFADVAFVHEHVALRDFDGLEQACQGIDSHGRHVAVDVRHIAGNVASADHGYVRHGRR